MTLLNWQTPVKLQYNCLKGIMNVLNRYSFEDKRYDGILQRFEDMDREIIEMVEECAESKN